MGTLDNIVAYKLDGMTSIKGPLDSPSGYKLIVLRFVKVLKVNLSTEAIEALVNCVECCVKV